MAAPGKRDALVDILIEGTREMPGCLGYVIATDTSDADTIWITEVWEDEDGHRASLALPAMRKAIETAKPLIARFGDRVVTTPVSPSSLGNAPSRRDAG